MNRLLRLSLAAVFMWYGALKFMGLSPVEPLLLQTLPWVPDEVLVNAVGGLEVAIGLGFLFPATVPIAVVLMWGELLGTFLAFVTCPERVYRGVNPFLLTTEGEFILKNLVFLAAGLMLLRPHGHFRWAHR